MTIVDLLRRTGSKHSIDTAVQFEGRRFSFADLEGGSNAAARVLRSHGVKRGDRVCLYAGTSLDFVLAYLGALKLGAVAVMANPAYRERELQWILQDAAPTVVVADRPGLERAARVAGPSVKCLLEIERGEGARPAPGTKVFPFYQAVKKASVHPVDEIVEDADLALILYTSGTTGRAKGAMLTHGNLVHDIRAVVEAFRWTQQDRFVFALPLFHVHGLCLGLHGTLVTGCETTLLARFDAREVLDQFRRQRATLFMGVPTMYARLLDAAEATGDAAQGLRSMRLFVSGSAPLPTVLCDAWRERFGHEILERYGMTETLITLSQPYDGPRRPGTVGVPLPGVEIRIVDAELHDLSAGETGELLVRGPTVGPGYWNDEAATAASRVDGWFRTGDLARRDPADGMISLVGRARDLILSGGYNVYPREVEEVLLAHPGVREVAVLGVPDEDLGERVVAAVVPDPTADVAVEPLLEHCRRELALYKVPREVRLVSELPKNAMGKVLKDELRGRFIGAG